jgi:long-chain fatty acid transport protein
MKNNKLNSLRKFLMRTGQSLLVATPLFALPTYGVGLQLMPGSSNFGSAGAGHAALGLDAGSAWANPATMVLVEDQQVGFGLIAAKTDLQFESSDEMANSGGNAGGEIFIPSAAYTHQINDELSAGFAFVVPFGNSIEYEQDWVGSNVATSASMETLQAMPSLAYRITDNVSLGFGLTVNETNIEQELSMRMNPLLPALDVALEADSIDYGWTLGGLYEFNDKHRFGFVYRSAIESDLEGSGTMAGSDYDTQLNWENPASIVVSGVHQVSDNTTLLWDIGRTFYSEFEQTQVHVDGLMDLTLHRDWNDANRYAVGTHYQMSESLILQAGYSLDESPVETENRNADMPLDDIQRFTLGGLYKMNTQTSLGLGLEYADLGNPSLSGSEEDGLFKAPNGQYDNSAVATSFSINYQF